MRASLTSLLALAIVVGLTAAAPAEEAKLQRRFTDQRMTYYYPGVGACGYTNTDTQYVVALNPTDYANGANCNRSLTITYQGNSAIATAVDLCPGCAADGLDLSPSLFEVFADLSVGVIYADWSWD
ncbi:plant expansin [Coniophora puteana RWD-64-598 SS2]|uniref:Plant expansin n=1 Tax=Coniophora puteana (strain RWD-64-598) TaxID=741705 RepID=R7SHT7_CONPW|nr:plant expansin [Coniophora puteana RWD-64-598 SS2]EIW74629.1 plant expansin [Coniophora puteana RWD-64-598 SS2]